jgi:hypothetical protein
MTDGRDNWHACVYWTDKIPHRVTEEELNIPSMTGQKFGQKVCLSLILIKDTVTAGDMWSSKILPAARWP